jgi:hypothetical protein
LKKTAKGSSIAKKVFSLAPKRPKRMQKPFSKQMGPSRTFYNPYFMSYLKKTAKKTHCSPFLKVYFLFERLIHRQNDFSLIPKRPKRMQKTFLRKMGPNGTFY